MTPYYAHVCILGWQTMLIWGFLIFFAQKKSLSIFSAKNGVFYEAYTKICCKNGPPQFTKSKPFYGQFTSFCMEKVL
jgi:hypothetical protein